MGRGYLTLDRLYMHVILTELEKPLPFQSIFAIQKIEDLSPQVLNQLNGKELRELESFPSEKRRREFASSRQLLKQLAGEWGLPSEEFCIYKNELGNPFAATASAQYEVSIAHTDEAVFCGISSKQPIGVDAEPMNRTVSDYLRTRMMHPNERKNRLDIPTLQLWTIKEAYIKLRGQGLRLNMNHVPVQQKEDSFTIHLSDDNRAEICSFAYENNWLAIAFYR